MGGLGAGVSWEGGRAGWGGELGGREKGLGGVVR